MTGWTEPRSTCNQLGAVSEQNLSALPPVTLPLTALAGPSALAHGVEPVAGLFRARFVGGGGGGGGGVTPSAAISAAAALACAVDVTFCTGPAQSRPCCPELLVLLAMIEFAWVDRNPLYAVVLAAVASFRRLRTKIPLKAGPSAPQFGSQGSVRMPLRTIRLVAESAIVRAVVTRLVFPVARESSARPARMTPWL